MAARPYPTTGTSVALTRRRSPPVPGVSDQEHVLGGGQVASVGKAIYTELGLLQFPPAAANAMVLLAAVVLMIAALTRIVDVRKEL